MDLDTARSTLQAYILDQHKAYQLYKLFRKALLFISGDSIPYSILNIIHILADNLVQCQTGIRKEEWFPVESTPNRRLILYKYLASVDYTEVDILTVRTLFQHLIKCIREENNIVPILKVLCQLLKQKKDVSDGYYLLLITQEISFIRDQQSERFLLNLLDLAMEDYFKPNELTIVIKELVQLGNFGMAEFLTSSSVYKVLPESEQFLYIKNLMRFSMAGFSDNSLASGAAILFKTVIETLDFESFFHFFNPFIRILFSEHPCNTSKTLLMSFTKYIVPLCGQRYELDLIHFSSDMHLYYKLIVSKYIYMTTGYIRDRNLFGGIIHRAATSNDINIVSMGFELLCYFHNAKIPITNEEILIFQNMLPMFTELTPVIRRSIHYFISQIIIQFVVNENSISLFKFLEIYQSTCVLLSNSISYNSPYEEAAVEIFCFTQEVLYNLSHPLVCPYNLTLQFEESPLYIALKYNTTCKQAYNSFMFLFNNFIKSSRDMPVVGNILIRTCSKWIDSYMVVRLYNCYMMASERKLPWSTDKSLQAFDIVIKGFCALNQVKTLRILEQVVSDSIKKSFNELESVEHLENYGVLSHLKALKKIMQVLPIEKTGCFDACRCTILHMQKLLAEYAQYSKSSFRSKSTRKNVEYILVAMVDFIFTTTKFTKYLETLVEEILFICSSLLDKNPMKKVLVYASQRLREVILATPQYEYKYINFYEREKCKYMTRGIPLTLRKSAGIKNFMHAILKSIKRLDFLSNEMESLIKNDTIENDQLILQLNLLEYIIADADLKLSTRKYVAPIFKKGLLNINSENFLVKNASIQLIAAIALRLLGPISELGVREFSAIDVFVIYPELAVIVNEFLFDRTSSFDAIISLLCFLAESNTVDHIQSSVSLFNVKLLKRYVSTYPISKYAIEAYIACCQNNRLYETLLNEYEDLKMYQDGSVQYINAVIVILRLTDRYTQLFPASEKYDEIFERKWELMDKPKVHQQCLSKYFPKNLAFATQERLEYEEDENDSVWLSAIIQVNCEYISAYLRCIHNFIDKSHFPCDYNINFFKILLRYLTGEDKLTPVLIFGLKEIIIHFLGYLGSNLKNIELKDHIQSAKDLNINIQELLITIICKNDKWKESDLAIVNDILEYFINLILQNISMNKIQIILNTMENLVKFLYIYSINMLNFLFITFSITYISSDNKQLSNIYRFLTAHRISNPRAALFLILKNLELYLNDTFLQKELLIKFAEYIGQPSTFSLSYIYSDADKCMDNINFQIKLNENVFFLLNSNKVTKQNVHLC